MTDQTNARSAAVESAHEAFCSIRDYVIAINEEDMLRPNRVGIWTGKDLVIHIADWESIGTRLIQDLEAGRPELWIPEGVDGNTFNEQRVEEHDASDLTESLELWDQAHKEFMDNYRDASVDREDILLGLTKNHYRSHLPDFRHVKPFKPLSDDERSQLLSDMDKAHEQFLAHIEAAPDEKLMREESIGIWSGKDLIAHLGHWQHAAIALTKALENDQPGKWPGEDGSNINEWNESLVEADRVMSLQETRAAQQLAFEQLRTLMATSKFATRSAGIGATQFHYDLHEEDFRSLV